jgi:hypothetical protein
VGSSSLSVPVFLRLCSSTYCSLLLLPQVYRHDAEKVSEEQLLEARHFFFLSLFLYLWPTDVAQGVRLMLQGVAGRLFPLDSITGDFATGDRRWYLAGPHSLASSSAALNITRAQGRIRTRSRKYYGVW